MAVLRYKRNTKIGAPLIQTNISAFYLVDNFVEGAPNFFEKSAVAPNGIVLRLSSLFTDYLFRVHNIGVAILDEYSDNKGPMLYIP